MSLELSDIQKQLEEISKKKKVNRYASRRANLARSGRKLQTFTGSEAEEKKQNANSKKIENAARKVVAAGGDASRVRGSGKTGLITTGRRRDTGITGKQRKGVSEVKIALGQKERSTPKTGKKGGKTGGAKKVTAPKPKKAPAPKKVKVSQDVREIASRQGLTIGGKKIGRAGKVGGVHIDTGSTPKPKPKLGKDVNQAPIYRKITSPKNINLSSVASLDALSWYLNKVAAQIYGGKEGGFSVSGHKPTTTKITTQGSGKNNMINPKTGKKWRAARDDAGNVVGAETPSTKPIINTQPNVQPTTFKSPNQKSPQSQGQKRSFALTTQPSPQGNQGGATTRGRGGATRSSDAVRRGIRGLKNTSVTSLEAVSWYLNKIAFDKHGKAVTGKGGGVKRTNTSIKAPSQSKGHEDFPVLSSETELENVKLQNYKNQSNSLDFVEFGLDVLKTLKNEIYKEDNPKITQDAKSLKVRGSDHRAKRKPIGSSKDDEKLSHKLNYD